MSDYYLEPGDNVVISEDTSVDDFYYRGGTIKVLPAYSFVVDGDFIFDAENIEDPVGTVFGCVLARVSIETGYNGAFTGFQIYDLYPRNTPLYFPCVVFDKQPESEITTNFFSGEWMETADIACDLAFKSNKYQTVAGQRLEKKTLAEHYMWYMRKIVQDITYMSNHIKVGIVEVDSSVQEPESANQKLYGFSLSMRVEFKKEDGVE